MLNKHPITGDHNFNKTYGTHKNPYISLLLLPIFGPINYGPPK